MKRGLTCLPFTFLTSLETTAPFVKVTMYSPSTAVQFGLPAAIEGATSAAAAKTEMELMARMRRKFMGIL